MSHPRERGLGLPPQWANVNSPTWKDIEATNKQPQETLANYRSTFERACYNLFDLSSHGLGHKIALPIKLEEIGLTPQQAADLCSHIGRSNFYACIPIQHPINIRTSHLPYKYTGPLSRNPKFQELFLRSSAIENDAVIEIARTDKNIDVNHLMFLSLTDLYLTHELIVTIFKHLETIAPGIVNGNFRPHNHHHERDRAWQHSPLLSGLRHRFGWVGHGQPTLRELITAAYQTLIEKGPSLNLPDQPTPFVFNSPFPNRV